MTTPSDPHDAAAVDGESAIDSSAFDDFRDAEAGGGANDFVAIIIAQYLSDATSLLAELKGAVEALDGSTVKHAAHSLRGSSATVGARRMAALCQELETLAGRPPVDGRPALDEGRALVLSLDVEFVRVRDALAAEQAINRG